MSLTSPLGLIGLIPWATVALWMLLGRRQRTEVPFLPLWEGGPKPAVKQRFEIPPIAVVLTLTAALVGILAAAGLNFRIAAPEPVTIIVDRGLTMSMKGSDGKWRYVNAAKLADTVIGAASVRLQVIPPAAVSGGNWVQQVANLKPTALSDTQAIEQAARDALHETTGRVLILSNQKLTVNDDRIAQVSPDGLPNHVGITRLSVVIHPHAQAMLRINNQSSAKTARIIILVGNARVAREIQLPPTLQEQNYFFDLPAVASIVEGRIDDPQNEALDDRAWQVLSGARPRVEARSVLPAEILRMIDVWSRLRPPDENGGTIAVVNSSTPIPTGAALVIVAGEGSGQPLNPEDYAVAALGELDLSNVNWSSLTDGQAVASPTGDWSTVVSWGKAPIVAVRLSPTRQVWLGFRSSRFASSVDFVLLWNDVLQWLSSGGAKYESTPVGQLGGSWRLVEPTGVLVDPGDEGLVPGIYRASDGSLKAVDATEFPQTWIVPQQALARISSSGVALHAVGSITALVALALLCLAAAASKPRNS